MKGIVKLTFLSLIILGFGMVSCKKDVESNGGVNGCMDINSPHFNPAATQDDGSCEYLYINDYELTNYEDVDWDLLINVDADVYLRVKRQSSVNWEFSSNTINNANPNIPQTWSAPDQFQLMNETYLWELYDEDVPPVDPDDAMASGSFSPVADGNNGVVVSTSSDGLTTVKIHYSQY